MNFSHHYILLLKDIRNLLEEQKNCTGREFCYGVKKVRGEKEVTKAFVIVFGCVYSVTNYIVIVVYKQQQ